MDLTLSAGNTLTVQQTVFGFGGKLLELIGQKSEDRVVTIPDTWPDTSSTYGSDNFLFVPKSIYAELATTGSTHLSLGLFDQTVSDALSWVDRLNALAAKVGVSTGTETTGEDVLLVTRTNDSGTAWVRLNGTLVEVNTIEAGNRFATYEILENADAPVILSLTLTPAARAEFSVLSAFEGFAVSEIKTTSP
ncbi:hypothetical protein EBS80_03415 [bacterium]|nr:hypothetical protein [bacterium]